MSSYDYSRDPLPSISSNLAIKVELSAEHMKSTPTRDDGPSKPHRYEHTRLRTSSTDADHQETIPNAVRSTNEEDLNSSTASNSATKKTIRILSAEDPGRYALIVLTLINLLNYIDRYVSNTSTLESAIECD